MKKFLLILLIALTTFSYLNAQSKRDAEVREQGPILRFYPNPAVSVISFDFQKPYDKGFSLQIYNFLGRKMYEQLNVSDHTTINLSDFTRGVYIYQLLDKTGKIVESGKFQVSK
ncbi:MAG TPA: T9SS type A sorting domain-containing protein [Flavisolibacter sp.]|nr:T9SS type A sorting domain-containing protein [Flavisolibacter sp.]